MRHTHWRTHYAANPRNHLPGGRPERPPKLDFKEKIEYAKWINDYTAKSAIDGENALPLYAELLKDAEGKGGFPDVDGAVKQQLDRCREPWTPEQFPDLAKFIEKNKNLLDVFVRATQVKRFSDPIEPGTTPFEKLLPYLSASRYCCRMVLARAWMKQPNQAEALAKAQKALLGAKNHVRQSGYLISDLVGLTEGSIVYSSTLDALHLGVISESDCSRWLRDIQNADTPMRPWRDIVMTEWASSLSMIQKVSPDGKVDAKTLVWANGIMGVEQPLTKQDLAAIARTNPRESVALVDSFFEELVTAVNGPFRWKNSEQMSELADQFKSKSKKASNQIATAFIPSFSRAYQISVRCESERRGTLLTLAIHAHHAKHRRWPESLSKIDPSIGLKNAKAVRVDPMTGERFLYRVKDEKPMLYSAGVDGDDDGGTHHEKFGENGEGGDFVFWPWQPK